MQLSDEATSILNLFNPNSSEIIKKLEKISPKLATELVNIIYEKSYNNDKISIKERHIATLAIITSMGTEPQIKFQGMAAFRIGFTFEEIEEILFQVAIFSGFSRAINAAIILREAYDNFLKEEY